MGVVFALVWGILLYCAGTWRSKMARGELPTQQA